jgi:hypothetical protein
MLERIGLEIKIRILSPPELFLITYIPSLEKPPEEQQWDLATFNIHDYFGHPGFSLIPWNYLVPIRKG